MPFDVKKTTLVASGQLSVEDAETLLEWLLKHPRGRLDLGACTHLHAANLQVLMAAHPHITVWPRHATLAEWLSAALTTEDETHVEDNSGR